MNQLSIQLLYWSEEDGITAKYLGAGHAYPFQLGWHCPKRDAYILHPHFIKKIIYQDDSAGISKAKPFWYNSKQDFEQKNPGWSNSIKAEIFVEDTHQTITLLPKFLDYDEILHYLNEYDLFPEGSLGDCEIKMYKPDRGSKKEETYLWDTKLVNL